MHTAASRYVKIIDAINRVIGRFAMYLIFVLMGILLYSSISKTFFAPSLWTLEMAQFAMVAYYILGGPYSIQLGSNVRMDLFYSNWSIRKKAWFDAFTVLLLIFYMGVLFHGAIDSAAYSLGHFKGEPYGFFVELFTGFLTGGVEGVGDVTGFIERSSTAWRPILWPIKFIMIIGFALMLLQAVSELIKDIATIQGVKL